MENGLIPINETAPTDVFVVGFPRSGHTWFQNLLAGVVFGVDPEFAHDSLIQDLVPDVHYKRYFKRYGPSAYFKSHALPSREYRRVIYLLRDGRDAMVSYWHFLSALQGPIDFHKLVEGEGLSPCHWHEHVERWLANPFQAEILVVRYEKLKAAPVEELQRFCAFAGIEREVAHLEHVVSNASFAKAKHKEQTQGWENPAWPREHAFIRRGEVGSWRDEMPPDVLAAFVKKAGATLTRLGYSD
jgi:hypothetical protein